MQQRFLVLYQVDVHCLRTFALVSDHAVANVCAQPHSVFHIDVQKLDITDLRNNQYTEQV